MSYNLNTNFDNDIDSFLNYDNSELTPLSSSTDVKPVPSLPHLSSSFSSTSQQFSGPSYQYDAYRQQTGLPMGGLANTFAVNRAQGLHYTGNAFVMPTETLNMPLSNLDDFDFKQPLNFPDMDMESDSPTEMPAMFYPGGSSNTSPTQPAPQRIYPGMHTEQAQQAQKQAAMRQQQPRPMPEGQRPLPTSGPKAPSAKDPQVEESISKLLSKMRQSSNASAASDDNDDEDDDDSHGRDSLAKMKKEEEEMDEDERLLNSEEGKKLSSKERRQLRNKVSARAFRSRRKEYISQLENDLAIKAQEANDLRVQNQQLMEENTRLTDLTRMLLSSKAFAGFLQELGSSGPNTIPQIAQQQIPTSQSQSQTQPKDVSVHKAARQLQGQNQHMQVGMTLIPETPVDMSIYDGGYNTFMPTNDFTVYSVTELPTPPALNLAPIMPKPQSLEAPSALSKDLPTISPTPASPSFRPEHIIVTGDDLYAEPQPSSSNVVLPLPDRLSLSLTKAVVISDLLSIAQDPSAKSSLTNLEEICEDLDEISERIERMMR